MSEIKVNSIKGVGASSAAITVNNSDGTCTLNATSNGGGQLANRNVIINGAALVNQRGDKTGTTTGGFGADRFQCVMNETGTLNIVQSSDSPNGFSYSHGLFQTTAQGSLDSNDLTAFRYNVEGFDVQRFKKGTSDAQQFTVSFFVKSVDQSSYPVTYILELRDPINTRSCCKSYTVTASNTWEYKTITFPADTTGAWTANNSKALEMNWFVAAGSNYTTGTLSTSWASTVTANRAAGLTANLSANTSNKFLISGVQLEVGSVATDFEHRSFGQELALCQRYYYVHVDGATSGSANEAIGTGTWYNGSEFYTAIHFPTTMRTVPSLEQASGSSYYYQNNAGGGGGFNDFSALWSGSPNMAFLSKTGSSGTQGAPAMVRTGSTSAKLAFKSEL